jgi:hypothetical protein
MIEVIAIITTAVFSTFLAMRIGYALGDRSNRKEDEPDDENLRYMR